MEAKRPKGFIGKELVATTYYSLGYLAVVMVSVVIWRLRGPGFDSYHRHTFWGGGLLLKQCSRLVHLEK